MGKLRVCRCGQLVPGRCPKCQPVIASGTTKERGYNSDWRRLSERYRACEPLCQVCLLDGRTTPATEVHHIVRVQESEAGRLDADNLLSVCGRCHQRAEEDQDLARRAKNAGYTR